MWPRRRASGNLFRPLPAPGLDRVRHHRHRHYSGREFLAPARARILLSGGGRLFGLGFPSTWYQPISVGTLTKALGLDDLWLNLMMLAIFFVLYLVAAKLILRKQET